MMVRAVFIAAMLAGICGAVRGPAVLRRAHPRRPGRRRHRRAGPAGRRRHHRRPHRRRSARSAARPRQTIIDARGLVVAPGFIDVHTHADEIADHPLAEHFVRMGVTTVVAGNCGGSADDVAAAFAAIEKTDVSVNYATLVGHNTVRRAVMGTRAPRADADGAREDAGAGRAGDERRRRRLLDRPAVRARHLCRAGRDRRAGADGGGRRRRLRHAHAQRGHRARSGRQARRSTIGEAAQMPVEISHLKVDAPSRWGASAKALAMIDAARAQRHEGRPPTCISTTPRARTLGIRFPVVGRSKAARTSINERLDDDATWARIKEEMKKLIRERGLENYSFARIASYRSRPVAERPVDSSTRPRKLLGSGRSRSAARDDAADAARRRRVDGLSVHVRGRHRAHPAASAGVDRLGQRR